ncbi:hypothetical protein MMYC01_200987 [Madurella mycetomatis]|uniref:Uncharacterized protein n=1 Tax=Madurella mycetomatis TaxID=100816 RepID=A0A175WGX7_9PEZI|nr:hypothetical protein MMYC01_200987 [Madurella mycetomatis]
MRQTFTAAFLLLLVRVPTLTHGLPYPLRRGDDRRPPSYSPSITREGNNADSDSIQVAFHPTANDTPQPTPIRDETIGQEQTVQGEGGTEYVLERALAELELLHRKLAELESEIHTREQWLAETVGAGSPGGIIDCDGVKCVARTILRRIRYATAAIFNVDEPRAGPLPPWRSPSQEHDNRLGNDTGGTHEPTGDESDFSNLSISLKLAILLLSLLALFRVVISHTAYGNGTFDSPSLTAGPLGWYERRGCESRQCQGFWHGGGRGFGGFQEQGHRGDRGLGVIGETESSYECDYGYGYGHGDEKGWPEDEKDARLFEERIEVSDPDANGENEDESENEETLTLAEEIASFRAVADMVGDIIAAEEDRARGR